jgi:hypothetical protein
MGGLGGVCAGFGNALFFFFFAATIGCLFACLFSGGLDSSHSLVHKDGDSRKSLQTALFLSWY